MKLKINKKLLDIFKKTTTTSDEYTYTCSYVNTQLGNKLNTNQVKTSNTTSNTDTYSCTFINNALNNKQNKITTLWTNSNPATAFAQQTITLSSSDYDILIFICQLFSGDGASGRKYITGTFKGNNVTLSVPGNYAGNACVFERDASRTSDTKYGIGGCTVRYGTTTVSENSFAIPYKVIGIKLS